MAQEIRVEVDGTARCNLLWRVSEQFDLSIIVVIILLYPRVKVIAHINLLMLRIRISIRRVTMFQTLFVKGIQLTSPAMGTAMPNLAPGFIFIIAWIFR